MTKSPKVLAVLGILVLSLAVAACATTRQTSGSPPGPEVRPAVAASSTSSDTRSGLARSTISPTLTR